MRVLLLSLFCVVLLHGANALCVPRSAKLKVGKSARPPATPVPVPSPVKSTPPPASTPPPVKSISAPPPTKSTSIPPPSESLPAPTPPPATKSPTPAPSANQPSPSKPSGASASVEAFCKKTDYPDVCTSSVQPFMPVNGNVGPKEMLIMEVNASVSKGAEAMSQVNKLLSDTITTPRLKGCLEVCKDTYGDLKSNFDEAVQALATSDIDTVKVMLSAAIQDVSSCDDSFAETPGLPTPMSAIDDQLSKLVSNCLALADLLS